MTDVPVADHVERRAVAAQPARERTRNHAEARPGVLRRLVSGALGRAGRGLMIAGLGGAAICGAAQGALAQGAVRETFNDWQLRCEKPAGASSEQCALVQNVAASDRPNVTLLVIILNTADGKGRLLRVLAPLGVLLPAGLGLKIDQSDVGRAGFVRCLPTGCVAEVVIDDNLVNRLKAGKIGTFIVFQTPEEGIGVPINLEGLDKGLAALK